MKKIVTAVVVGLFAWVPLVGADIALEQGLQNVSIDGHIDVDSLVGTEIALRAGYGKYVRPAIEVGGQFEFTDNDFITRYALLAYGEYNWDLDYYWVPFLGASLGLGGLDSFTDSGDSIAVELGLRGGAKYFVLDDFAITGTLGIGFSSWDTYDDGDSADNVDVRIDIGGKWFWKQPETLWRWVSSLDLTQVERGASIAPF